MIAAKLVIWAFDLFAILAVLGVLSFIWSGIRIVFRYAYRLGQRNPHHDPSFSHDWWKDKRWDR